MSKEKLKFIETRNGEFFIVINSNGLTVKKEDIKDLKKVTTPCGRTVWEGYLKDESDTIKETADTIKSSKK